MQYRDEHAPISPNQWGLVGGRQEEGELPLDAALRELREETDLVPERSLTLFFRGARPASSGLGSTMWHVYFSPTTATDADVVLGEGRSIVFVRPDLLPQLDLGVSAAFFVPLFLSSAEYAGCLGP